MSDQAILVFVTLPVLGLVIWSVAEVATRRDLPAVRRVGWIALLVLVPLIGLAIYVVVRPPSGAQLSGDGADASTAEQLVLVAERRQRGEISDAEYRESVGSILR